MRAIYNLILWLLFPFVLLRLVWRGRKQPEYLRDVAERFGLYRHGVGKPVIWIHAVSVGETRATVSLVSELERCFPEYHLLFTHTTPTGRATGKQLFGERVTRVYLPYDFTFAVRRFLAFFRPRIGILMETEIWFNLIQCASAANVPLVMLNARMSEKSARRYSRFPQLAGDALAEISAIAAQSELDAARLRSLGAPRVSVVGNLKFDIEPPAAQLQLGMVMRNSFGSHRKILIAASTREGEEPLLLDAFSGLNIPDVLLVLVPRHPQRFSEVAELIEAKGLAYAKRSMLSLNTDMSSGDEVISSAIRVVLGDSMGELFSYYAAADLAFIGGSLLPYGGQNLIEACAVGTPVVIGPHTYNFAEATSKSLAAGAAVQVSSSEELTERVRVLFTNPETLVSMAEKCREFVAANRGATMRSIEVIKVALLVQNDGHGNNSASANDFPA
jgi:3-deoxy-D-manno-octulosonic-acid transferase